VAWQQKWSDEGYSPPWLGRQVSKEIAAAVAEGWFPPGARALDIGCGEGEVAGWLAEHGFPTVGIDIAPAAIERARRRFTESSGRLEFYAVDVCSQSPPDWQYRVLVDRGCLHQIISRADRVAYLRTIVRVSAADARLLLFVKAYRDGQPVGDPTEQRRVVAAVEAELGRAFSIVRSADTYVDPDDGTQPERALGGMVFWMVRRSPDRRSG
jgi:SAM-dependent methyltransferase